MASCMVRTALKRAHGRWPPRLGWGLQGARSPPLGPLRRESPAPDRRPLSHCGGNRAARAFRRRLRMAPGQLSHCQRRLERDPKRSAAWLSQRAAQARRVTARRLSTHLRSRSKPLRSHRQLFRRSENHPVRASLPERGAFDDRRALGRAHHAPVVPHREPATPRPANASSFARSNSDWTGRKFSARNSSARRPTKCRSATASRVSASCPRSTGRYFSNARAWWKRSCATIRRESTRSRNSATKDRYRRVVERLARGSRHDELAVARRALTLARRPAAATGENRYSDRAGTACPAVGELGKRRFPRDTGSLRRRRTGLPHRLLPDRRRPQGFGARTRV